MDNKRAVSLVETLLCLGLFVVIMTACVTLLFRGSEAWRISSANVQIAQSLTQAISWMSQDMRQSAALVITDVPADNHMYAQITLTTPTGVLSGGVIQWNPLLIHYALGGVDGKQLIRTQNNQSRIVADHITSLQVSRLTLTPNIVNVQLTTSVPTYRGNQQLSLSISSKIFLRNT